MDWGTTRTGISLPCRYHVSVTPLSACQCRYEYHATLQSYSQRNHVERNVQSVYGAQNLKSDTSFKNMSITTGRFRVEVEMTIWPSPNNRSSKSVRC